MVLNIVYEDGSSHVTNLPDSFKWQERDADSQGSRRFNNTQCLIDDFSHGKEIKSAELVSSEGKIIYKE